MSTPASRPRGGAESSIRRWIQGLSPRRRGALSYGFFVLVLGALYMLAAALVIGPADTFTQSVGLLALLMLMALGCAAVLGHFVLDADLALWRTLLTGVLTPTVAGLLFCTVFTLGLGLPLVVPVLLGAWVYATAPAVLLSFLWFRVRARRRVTVERFQRK